MNRSLTGMRYLVEAYDWAATGIGARTDWPQSLRTTVDILLNTPAPMLLVVGPQRIVVYNDACAELVGHRHPAALGTPVDSIWPELASWHDSVLQRGYAGESQTYRQQPLRLALPPTEIQRQQDATRHGERRHAAGEATPDRWFDLFYTPVADEHGGTGGVLCLALDITGRLNALRQQKTAADALLARNSVLECEHASVRQVNSRLTAESAFLRDMFRQSPSFMAVVRGPQHVFELTNTPYQALIGERDVIGLPVTTALPELVAQGFGELLDWVIRERQPYIGKQVKVTLLSGGNDNGDGNGNIPVDHLLDFVCQPIEDADGAVSGIFIEGNDVTERANTEERLRIAQEAGGFGTFEWFPERGTLEGSPIFRAIWGIAPDMPLSADYLVSLIHPDDRARAGPARLQQSDNPLEYTEYRITRANDGEQRWIARRGEVMGQQQRTARRYVGVSIDITERKKIEEALLSAERRARASSEFVRLLLDSTEEAFYSIDRNGLTTLCNAAFLRMLGFADESEALGRPLYDVIQHSHADGTPCDASDSPICRAARTGQPAHVDHALFFRLDGSSFPVEYRVEPIWSDGELQGAICNFRDISARIERLGALRASEDRLSAIFGQASVGMSELDLKGNFKRVNGALCRILGRPSEEVLQLNIDDIIHPDDRAGNTLLFRRLIATGEPFALEKRYLKPDGTYVWISSNISRIVDDDGRPQALISVKTDISERRRAEEALRQLNETLEQRVREEVRQRTDTEAVLRQSQKMEALGQLTGGVAHDFNNVLQIIAGNLQLLESTLDREHDVAARQRLEKAIMAVGRGAKLSAHLLAFARRQPLEPVVANLGKMVRNMDDLLRRVLGDAIAIETVVSGGLWNTLVDTSQMENVILNLAINARDAMQGDGKLTLELGNALLDAHYARTHIDLEPGQYVLLSVSDNGSGMEADVLAKAFDPFFTTKPEGEGTGLGLSMAYGFVKQSRGHISIYSEPGQGTTVKIYLPRSTLAEAELPAAQTGPIGGGNETIMVVEDDASLRTTVVDILTTLGYRVLKAENAGDALVALTAAAAGLNAEISPEAAMPDTTDISNISDSSDNSNKSNLSATPRGRSPEIPAIAPVAERTQAAAEASKDQVHLLFTDVVMPGPLRSTELAEHAKRLFPDIAILYTSGYTRDAIVHGGRLDPGVELLSKPYRQEDLARKIRHMLQHRMQSALNRAPDRPESRSHRLDDMNRHEPPAAIPASPEPRTARILVVEDNLDSNEMLCELLRSLEHSADGVTSAEDALLLLAERDFDIVITDISLPGMSGIELAKRIACDKPGTRLVFASGYGPEIARNIDFPVTVLPKPFDFVVLEKTLADLTRPD